jgi:hypothetical protein
MEGDGEPPCTNPSDFPQARTDSFFMCPARHAEKILTGDYAIDRLSFFKGDIFGQDKEDFA